MSLKKYYDILGLPESVDSSEVRRQYRKLAMRLHPDKNPSPSAKDKFLLITEAYEILVGKRSVPVSKSNRVSQPKEKTHDERIRTAKNRYHAQQEKEFKANERYYKNLFIGKKWKLIKLASVIGCAFALAIIADYFLPSHYEADRITHYSRISYQEYSPSMPSLVKTKKEQFYWAEGVDYALYGQFPEVYIEKSWIFHNPIHLISPQKIKYVYYPVRYTFYSSGIIIAIFFLLPLLTRVYRRKTAFYTMLYHFSLYGSVGLMIYFLLTGDRWAHILTLGFF